MIYLYGVEECTLVLAETKEVDTVHEKYTVGTQKTANFFNHEVRIEQMIERQRAYNKVELVFLVEMHVLKQAGYCSDATSAGEISFFRRWFNPGHFGPELLAKNPEQSTGARANVEDGTYVFNSIPP